MSTRCGSYVSSVDPTSIRRVGSLAFSWSLLASVCIPISLRPFSTIDNSRGLDSSWTFLHSEWENWHSDKQVDAKAKQKSEHVDLSSLGGNW